MPFAKNAHAKSSIKDINTFSEPNISPYKAMPIYNNQILARTVGTNCFISRHAWQKNLQLIYNYNICAHMLKP